MSESLGEPSDRHEGLRPSEGDQVSALLPFSLSLLLEDKEDQASSVTLPNFRQGRIGSSVYIREKYGSIDR